MLALYRGLLRLYPSDYRHEYAAEMTSVFRQVHAVRKSEKLSSLVSFCAREIAGVIVGALRVRFHGVFGSQHSIPFRRFDMRPEFRFPRSTVFLMLVIFAAVVLTISKASGIELKYGSSSAVWPSLILTLTAVVALASAAAILIWGVLFALQRTGAHRLAGLEPYPGDQGPASPSR